MSSASSLEEPTPGRDVDVASDPTPRLREVKGVVWLSTEGTQPHGINDDDDVNSFLYTTTWRIMF
jgi:hypothetical protein